KARNVGAYLSPRQDPLAVAPYASTEDTETKALSCRGGGGVGWCGGLYGRPLVGQCAGSRGNGRGEAGIPVPQTGCHKGLHTIPRMASPAPLHRPRPYG